VRHKQWRAIYIFPSTLYNPAMIEDRRQEFIRLQNRIGGMVKLREEFENQPHPNYVQLFQDRLSAISLLPPDEQEWKAFRYKDLGVQKVKREAPGAIFTTPTSPFYFWMYETHNLDLWVTDPARIEKDDPIPHSTVKGEMTDFRCNVKTPINREEDYSLSAQVIQDQDDNIYLFVKPRMIDPTGEELRRKYSNDEAYLSMIERYGCILVTNARVPTSYGGTTIETVRFLDRDIVGELREEVYLRQFIKQFGLTERQFMRFRTFVLAAKEGNQRVNYTSIASEILTQKDE